MNYYLLIFSFIRPGNKAKRGVEFCHSIYKGSIGISCKNKGSGFDVHLMLTGNKPKRGVKLPHSTNNI